MHSSQVPAFRGGVGLEERGEQVHDFLVAAFGRVRPVAFDVVAGPLHPIASAGQAVRPEVRAPTDPPALPLAGAPVLPQTADGVAPVVRRWLGIPTGASVSAGGAARDCPEVP